MPVRVTICGDPPALSVMAITAVSAAADAGVKCPWMMQFAPIARLDPQGFGNTNEAASAPVTLMLVIARAALPVLVSVTCCGALDVPTSWMPNATPVADSDATGALPLSEIICVA